MLKGAEKTIVEDGSVEGKGIAQTRDVVAGVLATTDNGQVTGSGTRPAIKSDAESSAGPGLDELLKEYLSDNSEPTSNSNADNTNELLRRYLLDDSAVPIDDSDRPTLPEAAAIPFAKKVSRS